MMVTPPCNSSFCVQPLIGPRRKGYSCGIKTRMENVCSRIRNVCSRMENQRLANPTPWGMGRKSLKAYSDSLSTGNSCVMKTSQDVWGTPMNCWSYIGIAFFSPWWHLVLIPVRLWRKDFGHKVVWRWWSPTLCSLAMETSAKCS